MSSKMFKNARKNKNDEFYTQLQDIEFELQHYKHHFKNKTILCNCDNPLYSNFYLFFKNHFNEYQLKKLIISFINKSNPQSFKLEITSKNNNLQETKTLLNSNGDFRNNENIELLKESDIVATNPPFSLFREYVNQLIEYNKQFLIIGPKAATAYKDIFKLFKENKIWFGFGFKNGTGYFINKIYPKLPQLFSAPVYWYTNLQNSKRNEWLNLKEKYDPKKYLKYANYNAINVDKINQIPNDYQGAIGVPITILNQFNPDQFEIVGLGRSSFVQMDSYEKLEILKDGQPTGKYTIIKDLYLPHTKICKKEPMYKDKQGNLYINPYVRVLIKFKNQ